MHYSDQLFTLPYCASRFHQLSFFVFIPGHLRVHQRISLPSTSERSGQVWLLVLWQFYSPEFTKGRELSFSNSYPAVFCWLQVRCSWELAWIIQDSFECNWRQIYPLAYNCSRTLCNTGLISFQTTVKTWMQNCFDTISIRLNCYWGLVWKSNNYAFVKV